jgi:6-phosphofructokinase 1
MKRIAVLTSGGDCSGMNATLRAVVRAGLASGLEVLGIRKGYRGLLDRQHEILTTRSVSNILQRGGTFLQSARCKEMLTEEGQRRAADHLKGLGVEGLIVIGGDGSLRGALALHRQGVHTLAVPASIDNDIPYTDMALGVDTALNNIVHAVDCLKDTASSHDRTFVVETMGRNCGYLAVAAAVACGAEYAIVPEVPYDLEEICRNLRRRFEEGRDNSIIMVAEGVATAQTIAERIKDCVGFETRIMVLGHYQRGGSPSTFDRLLGARFGVAAVEGLMRGETGKMVGLQCTSMELTDLEKVMQEPSRPIDQMILKLARTLGA